MVYTATTWVSGDVITAARLNNLEGQFDDAYGYIRYSTASTGTVLINLPGTYDSTGTVGQWITTIMVPVNVQKSRVEVSCSLYSYYSSYPLYLNVYRTDMFDPTTSKQSRI